MKNKHVKTILVQWFIPFAVLFLVVCIALIRFSVTSRITEVKEVQNTLIKTTETYAERFKNKIDILKATAETLSDFVVTCTEEEIEMAQNATTAVKENTEAYMVVMCDLKGEGITQTGEKVELGETEYFLDVERDKMSYRWSEDDGMEGHRCVVVSVPLKKEERTNGFLFVYYDAADFSDMIKKMEFDTSAYYGVIDGDGKIICWAGADNDLFNISDFWGTLLEQAENKSEIEREYKRFKKSKEGVINVALEEGKDDMTLIFAPVGINDWKMMIGINRSYVSTLEEREWASNRAMLVRLIAYMLIFGGVLVIVNIVAKILETKKRKILAEQAETDLLTGLCNKVATESKISSYMASHPQEQGVLFLLDIDNFKQINDTMGHAFGDEVLRTLGHQIRAEFRVSDIIGRIGGDEFMLFLKGMKDDDIIRKEAGKLEDFFHNFRAGEYVKYSATASIGAAVFPRDAKDFGSLYRAADQALYSAKKRGKNQLAFYHDAKEIDAAEAKE